ncbi:DUF1467 family protein [Paracoccus siganidrum]|uniref:DUF1467 family protein n=1 Tax=Paracoccus siganidrum TaxID=1276757 RepID=A0A419A3S7_9RHOB|nr:DUF1467 family protein [Paracoccus siganidrum]RJL08500.1 DUF1467 family protein [Paracoccus siganidrum]RMC30065.1 DUF1467 domain-containing protein [Paracoccus siganidrum]
MNLTGAVVLYASIWFLALFVVMPIGQRSQADLGEVVPGTPPGAPGRLAWRRKLLLTTGITTVLWGIIAWLILGGIVTRAHIENLDHLIR